MALPRVPLDIIPHKREREWESDIDASSVNSSKRVCKELDVGELDVQEELEAEPFEEDLISDVMKSLEQEIQTPPMSSSVSKEIAYGSITPVSADEERSFDVDIEYLLEATDKELGIPASPTTELQQLTSEEEFGNLFEKGTEDVFHLCFFGDAYAEAESVALLYEDEDWMAWPLSQGLFEAPHL